jgi:integral membrane sensor domain MASE1
MLPAALKWLRQSARDRTYLLTVAVIALAYIGAASFGHTFGRMAPHLSAVWPASGIALAAMLLRGYRVWPGIFLGAAIASATSGNSWWVCLASGAINVLGAGLGTFLLQRGFRFQQEFRSPYDVLAFLVSAVLSTLLIALVGSLVIVAAGYSDWPTYHTLALAWWESMLMGDLVFAPLILVYFSRGAITEIRDNYMEVGLVMASVFASSLVIMTQKYPLWYLLFPLMVWVAVRLTQVGVVTAIIIITAVSLWATYSDLGPFARAYAEGMDLIALQFFISVLSGTSLIVAMAMSERLVSETKLKRKQEQLERLDLELKEANRRVMHILGELLDEKTDRRSHFKRDDNDHLGKP